MEIITKLDTVREEVIIMIPTATGTLEITFKLDAANVNNITDNLAKANPILMRTLDYLTGMFGMKVCIK